MRTKLRNLSCARARAQILKLARKTCSGPKIPRTLQTHVTVYTMPTLPNPDKNQTKNEALFQQEVIYSGNIHFNSKEILCVFIVCIHQYVVKPYE